MPIATRRSIDPSVVGIALLVEKRKENMTISGDENGSDPMKCWKIIEDNLNKLDTLITPA